MRYTPCGSLRNTRLPRYGIIFCVYLYDYGYINNNETIVIYLSYADFWFSKYGKYTYDLFVLNGLFWKLHSYVIRVTVTASYWNRTIGLQFTWFPINSIFYKIGLLEMPTNLSIRRLFMRSLLWQQFIKLKYYQKVRRNAKYVRLKNQMWQV